MTEPGLPVPPTQVASARLKLALMFAIPLVVIGAAYFVFYTGLGIPSATTNRGVLLQPKRSIPCIR